MTDKHYVDRAKELQAEMDRRGLRTMEYCRITGATKGTVENLRGLLRYSEVVLKQLKNSNLTLHRARILKRLNKKVSDQELCKMIRFTDYDQMNEKRFLKFIKYIADKNNIKLDRGYLKY